MAAPAGEAGASLAGWFGCKCQGPSQRAERMGLATVLGAGAWLGRGSPPGSQEAAQLQGEGRLALSAQGQPRTRAVVGQRAPAET